MTTQITKQTTNYIISSSNNEEIKLEGTFSITQDNKIENYNSSVFNNEGTLIGTSNYGEYENNVNYNYNVQPDFKAVVIALMDESINNIKSELNK